MTLLWALQAALAAADPLPPACDAAAPGPDDAPGLYLITASPGPQPFSFIGHSSLWVRDASRGLNHVWEYGVIDSSKQEPLSSLLLGTLDCSWQVRRVHQEARDYVRQERTAVAHPLLLPADTQAAVVEALLEISEDLDRTDRFHWRQNSCATKVRDVVAAPMDGALEAALAGPAPQSPHGDVLRHVGPVPWAWLGLHLAAGAPTDAPQTWWEAGFVPERLQQGMAAATVGGAPLLGPPCTLAEGPNRWPGEAPPLRPGLLWAAGAAVAGAGLALARGGRVGRALAGLGLAGWGLLWGALGSVLVGLWAASALADFGPNATLLLASPLTLALVPLGVVWARGRAPAWGRPLTAALAVLGLVAAALALLPLWPQPLWGRVGLLWPPLLAAAWWARRPS